MGIMKGLLYRDLGRLRHDWVMLTFVVIGGAMPWISLIRDGIERADAAAATVGLAAALASMLMIVDWSEGIAATASSRRSGSVAGPWGSMWRKSCCWARSRSRDTPS